VSAGGGTWPRWRRDGKEIFYSSPDNKIMAAEVKTSGASFEVGTIRPLFEARLARGTEPAFDVTADGQRFVYVEEKGEANTAISLFVNWDAGLKKK
jgi:eukaryotic-like serine/threonine-protein kinase